MVKDFPNQKCHPSCKNGCYGDSKSKYNCRDCRDDSSSTYNYFNTESETELICSELYQNNQIKSFKTTNPDDKVWRYVDCDFFQVFKINSALMDVYDPTIPNWRCQTAPDFSNKLGVIRVKSIKFEGSHIGSNTYGRYKCLIDCPIYPYLQLYSELCKDYEEVAVDIGKNEYTCCRYKALTANGQCILSCFE